MLDINICLQKNDSEKPLIWGLFVDQKVEINPNIDNDIEELIKNKIVKLELGQVNKIATFSKIKSKVIYLVGLGKKEEYSQEKLKEATKNINSDIGKEVVIDFHSFIGTLDVQEAAFNYILNAHYYNYKYFYLYQAFL